MRRIAMILVLFGLLLAGCASPSTSAPPPPLPRRPHPGAVWIPGHRAPNGAWIAGHWR